MVLLYLLITILCGVLLVNLINSRAEFVYKLSLGFFFGLGVSAFVIFILNFYGLLFDKTLILTTSFVTLFLLLCVNQTNNLLFTLYDQLVSLIKDVKNNKFTFLEKVLMLVATFLTISSLAHNIYWPVYEWDSLALYDYRGKFLSVTGDIHSVINNPYDITHPPLTSVMHAVIYELGGTRPTVIYTLMYFFVSIFTINFIKTSRYFVALSLLFMLYYYPSSISTYSNFPYMVYALVGFASLYQYIYSKGKDFKYLFLSSLAFGISVWIRQGDHLFLIALSTNLIFVLINRGKFFLHFLFSFIFILIFYQSWDYLKIILVPTSSYVAERVYSGLGGLDFDVLSRVIALIYKNSIYPNVLYMIAIFTMPCLKYCSYKKIAFSDLYFPLLVLGHIGMLTTMLFVFSGLWGGWEALSNSIYRMSNFYLGLMILSVASYRYD